MPVSTFFFARLVISEKEGKKEICQKTPLKLGEDMSGRVFTNNKDEVRDGTFMTDSGHKRKEDRPAPRLQRFEGPYYRFRDADGI